MFSEKTRLTEKRENPFYGSYKESSVLEEAHWQNRKKKQQLTIVAIVVIVLVVLSIGVTLAITLPTVLDNNASRVLSPPDPDVYPGPSRSILGQYSKAGVSSDVSDCTEIGKDVLIRLNGTAVDAAIAISLCLGVVSPQSSGLGGGLFMTVYVPASDQVYSLNARETAPSDADQELYNSDPTASRNGGAAVGVPGELAGLYAAYVRFGSVDWAELVKPAQQLAQHGFTVRRNLANSIASHASRIKGDSVLSSEFLNPATREPWVEGDVINRPRLARTLATIATSGPGEFYNGSLAEIIESEIGKADGLVTLDDLSNYRVEWEEPISHKFDNNLTLYGPSFPSSAPVVALALMILEGYGRKRAQGLTAVENSLDTHQLAEVLKFADAHRARVSDPNFSDVTELLEQLLSRDYADELRSRIEPYKSFDDPSHYGGVFADVKDSGTVHISIIGPDGDACSLTSSINHGFGAGFMGNTTGIIYNDQLDDFSFSNSSNVYGLPPNPHNSLEPGKRPASSMSPLIFLNDKREPVLAIGGAGGSKIVPALISTIWRALYRDLDIKTSIDQPRLYPTFNPPRINYEYGVPAPLVADLERRGHQLSRINLDSHVGNVNAVCVTKVSHLVLANADYRKRGSSAGF